MAQRARRKDQPLSRAEAREARLRELRASAQATGTTEAMFPTYQPAYDMAAVSTAFYPLVTPSAPASADPDEPVQEGRLASLAHEINTRFTLADKLDGQANDHRLAAAIRLAEAKTFCEESKMPFRKWAEHHISQSWVSVRMLARVGQAEDPKQALEDMRAKNAEANKALRERDRERKLLARGEAADVKPNPFAATSVTEAPQPPRDPPAAVVEAVEPFGNSAPEAEHEPQAPAANDPDGALEDIMLGLMLLSTDERLSVADAAAVRLPADKAREHIEHIADKIGLEIVRDGSANFFVTVDTMMKEFEQLQGEAKAEFLRRAMEQMEMTPNA